MQSLFELEACRTFLLHHDRRRIEWFNKERFEELCEWITLLMLMEGCSVPLSCQGCYCKNGWAERAISLNVKLAQDAGYRSRLFLELPEKAVVRRTPRVKKTCVMIRRVSGSDSPCIIQIPPWRTGHEKRCMLCVPLLSRYPLCRRLPITSAVPTAILSPPETASLPLRSNVTPCRYVQARGTGEVIGGVGRDKNCLYRSAGVELYSGFNSTALR